ncbi:MAG TPA: 6-pyruvoyl-tetrahydropterin synthase-related protein [Candidatus Methanofastidiosa archaeon]|nr:6-pyruvoyl-tetrahydropterin synthase-related protein [Candidatus Methanofastidiosa archaeon]
MDFDKREFLNKYLFLFVIIAILTVFSYFLVLKNYSAGVAWDTCDYLTNALLIKGNPHIEYAVLPIRPPLISMLTAFFFWMVGEHEVVIMVLDCAAYIVSAAAFYMILQYRFGKYVPVAGTLIYACSTLMLSWAGVGYSDIMGIACALIFFYLLIMAHEEDKRYAIPLWVFMLFMIMARHTNPILVVVALMYVMFRWRNVSIRYHFYGLIAAIIAYIPFAYVFNKGYGGPFDYFSLILDNALSGYSSGGGTSPFYIPDKMYYFKQIDDIVFSNEFVARALIAVFLIGFIYSIFRMSSDTKKPVRGTVMMLLALVLCFVVVKYFGFIMAFVLLFVILGSIGLYLNAQKEKNIAIDVMFLFWFFLCISYYSNLEIKDQRFIIAFVPAIYYIFTMGIWGLTFFDITPKVKSSYIIVPAISALMIFGAVQAIGPGEVLDVYNSGEKAEGLVKDIGTLSDFLKAYDENYEDTIIFSDRWVFVSWNLKKTAYEIDSEATSERLDYDLQMYNADYLFGPSNKVLESFAIIKETATYILFEREYEVEKPWILYIGRNFENYVGEVVSYSFYITNGETNKNQYSQYIDDYTLEDLNSYDAVLLYNFKWHSKDDALDLLAQYLNGGGKLIVDLSGNMADDTWNYGLVSLLGIIPQRVTVPTEPSFTLYAPFDENEYDFSEFITEEGEWMAITLSIPDSTEDMDILMRSRDVVFAAHREIGDGHVIILGGNMIYHSYIKFNYSERQFIEDVFQYTLDLE